MLEAPPSLRRPTAVLGIHTAPNRATWALAAALGVVVLAGACSSPSVPTAPTPSTVSAPAAPEQPSPPPPPPSPVPTPVRYRVVFDALWSQATHPRDYPGNPHFSPLIRATHSAAVRFWAEGAIASDGIKRMAEQGFSSPLDAHINDAIAAGTARALLRGDQVRLSPASVALEIEEHQSHPLLTLVTMVAPSPAWFVGVGALPLFGDGRWVESITVELRPWDAGTDAGSSYGSADAPVKTAPADHPNSPARRWG